MRWALLLIFLVASGVIVALWRSSGSESTPMLFAALGIALFFSIVPLALGKRASTKPRTTVSKSPQHPRQETGAPRR